MGNEIPDKQLGDLRGGIICHPKNVSPSFLRLRSGIFFPLFPAEGRGERRKEYQKPAQEQADIERYPPREQFDASRVGNQAVETVEEQSVRHADRTRYRHSVRAEYDEPLRDQHLPRERRVPAGREENAQRHADVAETL